MKTHGNDVGVAGGWKENDRPWLDNSRIEAKTLLLPVFPKLPIGSGNVLDFIGTEGFRELHQRSQTRRFGGVEVLQKPGARQQIEPACVADAVDIGIVVTRKLYAVFVSAMVRPSRCGGIVLAAIVTYAYVRFLFGNQIMEQT